MTDKKQIVISDKELFEKIKVVVQHFESKKSEIKLVPVIMIIMLFLNLVANTCVLVVLGSYKKHIDSYTQFEHIVNRVAKKTILIERKLEDVESRNNTFGDHLIYNTNEVSKLRQAYEERFGTIKQKTK